MLESDMREILQEEHLSHIQLFIRPRRDDEVQNLAAYMQPRFDFSFRRIFTGKFPHELHMFTQTMDQFGIWTPSIFMHEVAHVKTAYEAESHSYRWAKEMIKLGIKYKIPWYLMFSAEKDYINPHIERLFKKDFDQSYRMVR